MKKLIVLEGQKIEYLLRRYRRAKNLRLAISARNGLVVSKPWYVNQGQVERFIQTQAKWVLEKLAYLKKNSSGQTPTERHKEYLANKTKARKLILQKIKEFNTEYKFKFAKISIRNQATRWGSCSSRGNLNFNYKIIFLSEPLIDYIVVHELCHLQELNHSLRFWQLVSLKIPNYRILKKDLQKQGIALS